MAGLFLPFFFVVPCSFAPCRLDVAAQAVKRCRRRLFNYGFRYQYINIYGYIAIWIAYIGLCFGNPPICAPLLSLVSCPVRPACRSLIGLPRPWYRRTPRLALVSLCRFPSFPLIGSNPSRWLPFICLSMGLVLPPCHTSWLTAYTLALLSFL